MTILCSSQHLLGQTSYAPSTSIRVAAQHFRAPYVMAERIPADQIGATIIVSDGIRPRSVSPAKPLGQRKLSGMQMPSRTNNNINTGVTITPKALAQYLVQKENPPSVLLLDVRPREHFESGCIKHKWVVQIEPLILRPGYVRSNNIANRPVY